MNIYTCPSPGELYSYSVYMYGDLRGRSHGTGEGRTKQNGCGFSSKALSPAPTGT